ncbi:MAG TPA: 4'-phosphopantetheinyl transferase superfamily protein [Actinocrinis sp.]|nr:4'-phosphopantetheinyl transferase superfamily protein [Actinocrinis sp.]
MDRSNPATTAARPSGPRPPALIVAIAPEPAAAFDTRADILDAPLFPGERETVRRAVASRCAEFTTGRACARGALAGLGLAACEIPTGPRGEPHWPRGVVGSIAHCDGYRGAVVGHTEQIVSIGIDAEPNRPLPDGVLEAVSLPEEANWVDRLLATAPEIRWDRLLFCTKEAVYKTWFPLTRSWLDFQDAMVTVDPVNERFTARLRVAGPAFQGRELIGFSGRFLVRDGLILTSIVLVRRPRAVPSGMLLARSSGAAAMAADAL